MSAKSHNILVVESDGFSSEAESLLRRHGTLVLADMGREELLSAAREADVLWVRLRHRIDAEVIASAHRLKVIVTPTTGLNHIDLDEANRRGIRVLSLQGETEFLNDIRATAEHTVGLMLSLLRRVPSALEHVRNGGWNRDLFKGQELFGKTVGIIGYGRLGRIIARYLKAFDTNLLAADPNVDVGSFEPHIRPALLAQLLREAQLVTLHVDLDDRTRGFFGQEQFAMMREGAWFINTSRGELVDESALLDALRSGWLAGAALDVLCGEYSDGIEHHPLVAYARNHDNLIITPHIGGCTAESMEKTELFLAEKFSTIWLTAE